ncbi:hypothetical protein IGI52_003735 [Enterococcus sp. DIV0187]
MGERNDNSKRRCTNCHRVMKQQFIGLKHCKCGMSWSKEMGYFQRTTDMTFALQRQKIKKSKHSMKNKRIPIIREED